ncbi:MAG TPA: isoprenylcysteine carboxylmethyltransferase family protein [Dehalococcoidales bacterium]|nr:isoprenylcysteine carboxylmethyltransferase family protein [Dehalococcoidales bacterium]
MWVNRFFSSVVRIQKDRGQEVVQNGPYHSVRHPGYVGGILMAISTSLVLGSLWALIPAGVIFILLVIRTYLEDTTLQKELTGYADYAKKVRFRLLPGIW